MQEQEMQGKGGSAQAIQDALRNCDECSSASRALFTRDVLSKALPKDKPFTLLVPNNQAIMKDQSVLMSMLMLLSLLSVLVLSDQDKQNLVKLHVLNEAQPQLKQGKLAALSGRDHQVTGQQGKDCAKLFLILKIPSRSTRLRSLASFTRFLTAAAAAFT
jgi:hypothetical protein